MTPGSDNFGQQDRITGSAAPKPPADVWEWVCETYDTEGVVIWLRAYQDGDDAKRRHLESLARTPSGGT